QMENEKLKGKNSSCRTRARRLALGILTAFWCTGIFSGFLLFNFEFSVFGFAFRRRRSRSSASDHGLPGLGLPRRAGRGQAAGLVFAGGADKRLEQRVGSEGTRLELGMELATQEPRVVANLDNLDVGAVRSVAGNGEAVRHQHLVVFAVEFVAVTVPLRDLERPVG